MKLRLLLATCLLLASATAALAQGGGDRVGHGDIPAPLMSVTYPVSPMMETPIARKVEIYANGHVVETISNYSRSTTIPEVTFRGITVLGAAKMKRVNICTTQLADVSITVKPNTGCMDDAGTYYRGIYGEKLFAVSFCGQLQGNSSPCAREMIKLLQTLSYGN